MPNAKPIIGCTEPSMFTPDVICAIEKYFNANPIKLCQNELEDIHHWVDMCSAVILSGGIDIHPRTYGSSVFNHQNLSKFDFSRDRREFHIIDRCFERNIPILGICRGHQMLGIYHNIKLIQDISDSSLCHQPLAQKISYEKDSPMHWVKLTKEGAERFKDINPQSRYVFKKQSKKLNNLLWVNSFHHQALLFEAEESNTTDTAGKTNQANKNQNNKKPEADYKVLGISNYTDKVSINELMEGTKNRWISCQWHPEFDWQENYHSQMIFERLKNLIIEN